MNGKAILSQVKNPHFHLPFMDIDPPINDPHSDDDSESSSSDELTRNSGESDNANFNVRLLTAISQVHQACLLKQDSTAVIKTLLSSLLLASHSEFGIISVVRRRSNGLPYVSASMMGDWFTIIQNSITPGSLWIEGKCQTRGNFNQDQVGETAHMSPLLDAIIEAGEEGIICNNPRAEPWFCPSPQGQNEMECVMGKALFMHGDIVGLFVAINRRMGEYNDSLLHGLEPFIGVAAQTLHVLKENEQSNMVERFLLGVMQTSRDGVLLADAKGCLVAMNTIAEEIFLIQESSSSGNSNEIGSPHGKKAKASTSESINKKSSNEDLARMSFSSTNSTHKSNSISSYPKKNVTKSPSNLHCFQNRVIKKSLRNVEMTKFINSIDGKEDYLEFGLHKFLGGVRIANGKQEDGNDVGLEMTMSKVEGPFNAEYFIFVLWKKVNSSKGGSSRHSSSSSEIKLWEFVLESSSQGIFDWDVMNDYVTYSERWKELIGYKGEEIGTSIEEWKSRIHPDEKEKVLSELEKHLQNAIKEVQVEQRLKCKDGSFHLFTQKGKVISRDKNGKALRFVGIHSDAQCKKEIEAVEEANKLRAEFLATMSHEIRTPLNGVIGMTNILLETKLSEHQKECALLVRDSGNTLLNLINDICDFRKIESGRLKEEMNVEPFNFLDVISQAVGIVSTHVRSKGLELVVDVDDIHKCNCVVGDVSLTLQLILNLLGNAIKFTENGHISIGIKRQKGAKNAPLLECSITDTGIGIPLGKQSRLFKHFSQVDGSSTRRFGGTGLGLTISKQLVELMGGSMKFTSKANAGSTFTFLLPSHNQKLCKNSVSKMTQPMIASNAMDVSSSNFDDVQLSRVVLVGFPKVSQNVLSKQLFSLGIDVQNVDVETYDHFTDGLNYFLTKYDEHSNGSSSASDSGSRKSSNESHPFDCLIIDFDGLQFDTELLFADPMLASIPMVIMSSKQQLSVQASKKLVIKPIYLQKPVVYSNVLLNAIKDSIQLHVQPNLDGTGKPLDDAGDLGSTNDGIASSRKRSADDSMDLSEVKPGSPTKRLRDKEQCDANTSKKSYRSAKVLVVEDNRVNQIVVRSMLKAFGIEADVVNNGCEAVQAAQNGFYHLILMDCQMPQMDGYTASRKIRQLETEKWLGKLQRIPIVALTANALQGDREKCLEAGMSDYISKPLTKEALMHTLDMWLDLGTEN